MIKYLLIIFLILFSTAKIVAQKTTIRGIVQDESAHSLPFAAVLLLQDSTLISTFQTEEDGEFHLLTDNSDSIFILKITYVGYEKFEQKITISTSKTDTLNLGFLKMTPLSIRLAEAVISAQRNPVEIRGDTLAFAASAFKTQPNALAEDLLPLLFLVLTFDVIDDVVVVVSSCSVASVVDECNSDRVGCCCGDDDDVTTR